MNITKIKRFLAKYGIGNPLNQLLYTSQEIKEIKKQEEAITLMKSEQKEKKREKILDARLDKVCELWCEWNIHKLDSRDFALKFEKIFKKETSIKWREIHKLK